MSTSPFKENNRLLVIDDKEAIHADFRKILQPPDERSAGLDAAGAQLFGEGPRPAKAATFEITSAHTGEQGLALVEKALAEGLPYALAFVDVRMAPGWDGIETAARICKFDPDIQIVICTAHSDYSWEAMIGKLGQSDRLLILKKPFDNVEVLQLVHALTKKWELGQTARTRMDQLEMMVAERTQAIEVANGQLKNEIAERARTEEIMRQMQKMEAIGQFAAGVAHDINNILTIIEGHTGLLLRSLPPKGDAASSLKQISAASERAAGFIRHLLMFSRKQVFQTKVIDLNAVLRNLETMLPRMLGEAITLETRYQSGLPPIAADTTMMEQMVMNLTANARDSMPKGGKVLIETSLMEIGADWIRHNPEASAGDFVCLKVTDNGCGVEPHILPRIFEPFFTTKEMGKGTGIGLATVYGIVKQHDGWVEVDSEVGVGTNFKIFLPALKNETLPAPNVSTPETVNGGEETILVVEDEIRLLEIVRKVLESYHYRILTAPSVVEALRVWEEHSERIDLLLTDMIMPGRVTGADLAVMLKKQKPSLQVIITSGYSSDLAGRDMGQCKTHFLAKPYQPQDAAKMIRDALSEARQSCPSPHPNGNTAR
jgi:signal transduction histidine kinase